MTAGSAEMVLISIVSPSSVPMVLAARGNVRFHLVDHGRLRIAQVHRHEHVAGNNVRRSGLHFQNADGADRFRMNTRGLVHSLDQPRRAEQRVVPAVHRRGAGMAVLAGERRLVPAHRLHAGDNADVLAFGFEKRALLDMHFEESRERMIAAALPCPR